MSLGGEIVATALTYARARFEELRDDQLADVQAFADALGTPGFVDAGGEVEGHLTAAKNALSQAQTDIGNGNLIGAAGQLGTAIDRLDQASRTVTGAAPAAPSPLIALLEDAIGWANVAPKGLAGQLGLPAEVPALAIVDGALTYTARSAGESAVAHS